MLLAGKEVAAIQVSETTRMLRYYSRFLRDGLPGQQCRNLESEWRETFDKDECRARLAFLVDVAINRKAGIPDSFRSEQQLRESISGQTIAFLTGPQYARVNLRRDVERLPWRYRRHLLHRCNPERWD